VTREAEATLRKAVIADPVCAAAARLLAARVTRYEQALDAISAARRLARSEPPAAPVGALDLHEYVSRVVRSEASDRADQTRAMKGRP
jgi:cytochrome c-type biogenesis protein CcmH/NrfG